MAFACRAGVSLGTAALVVDERARNAELLEVLVGLVASQASGSPDNPEKTEL